MPEAERAQLAKTAISADTSEQSIALALAVADRFTLKHEAALTILKQVVPVVRQW